MAKRLQAFAGGPVIKDGYYVYLCRYLYDGARAYVAKLCALTAKLLAPWRGHFVMRPHALCLERAILMPQFRYTDLSEMPFWNIQARWERRTLSGIGLFVPYQLICCYKLSDMACNPLLLRIMQNYTNLEVFHGFNFAKDPVFA